MPLVVEDGTGKTNADSYLSITDADDYHLNHSASISWSGASEAIKEKALRLATQYVDAHFDGRWKGLKKTSTQALAWPRSYAVDSDGYAIDSESIPQRLIDAVAELALRVVNGDTLYDDIDKPGLISSKSVTVGPISKSTTYVAGMSQTKKYQLIDALLAPLIQVSGCLERG